MNRVPSIYKVIAIFTALCVECTSLSIPLARAEVIPQSAPSIKKLNLELLKLPTKFGEVVESHSGNGAVIIVQDAHAIPDAQRNIANIIRHLQKEYGVGTVALEGASGDLDPQIFRSFPDKKLLRQVMKGYMDAGEIAGGTAAAVFDETPTKYVGVEDWDVYEEGLGLYLAAMEKEPELLEKLNAERLTLNAEKEKIYSKELLAVDQAVEKFYENAAQLTDLIKLLGAVKAPQAGSELDALWKEIKKSHEPRATGHEKDIEVRELAAKVEKALSEPRTTDPATAGRHGPRSEVAQPVKQRGLSPLAEFNSKKQEWMTGEISAEAFALYLKETAQKLGLKLEMSSELHGMVKDQHTLKGIEGTKLFKELETYIREAKQQLIERTTDHEPHQGGQARATTGDSSSGSVLRQGGQASKARGLTPMLLDLDQRTESLRSLTKLAKLELSREEWKQLKAKGTDPYVALGTGSVPIDTNDLVFQLAFYLNAEERDEIFFKNLVANQEPGTKNQGIQIIVAGGFHAEGITSRLKEAGIGYALVMPKINHIPESLNYRAQMRGEVSWKDYFEVENGRIHLYKAFVRATRDRLLSRTTNHEPRTTQDKNVDRGPLSVDRSSEDLRLLKSWRDQIIRDLSDKGKVQRAAWYTRYMDEVVVERGLSPSKAGGTDPYAPMDKLMMKVDNFIRGLRGLEKANQLTSEQIAALLKANMLSAAATSPANVVPGATMAAAPKASVARVAGRLARSEARKFQETMKELLRNASRQNDFSNAVKQQVEKDLITLIDQAPKDMPLIILGAGNLEGIPLQHALEKGIESIVLVDLSPQKTLEKLAELEQSGQITSEQRSKIQVVPADLSMLSDEFVTEIDDAIAGKENANGVPLDIRQVLANYRDSFIATELPKELTAWEGKGGVVVSVLLENNLAALVEATLDELLKQRSIYYDFSSLNLDTALLKGHATLMQKLIAPQQGRGYFISVANVVSPLRRAMGTRMKDENEQWGKLKNFLKTFGWSPNFQELRELILAIPEELQPKIMGSPYGSRDWLFYGDSNGPFHPFFNLLSSKYRTFNQFPSDEMSLIEAITIEPRSAHSEIKAEGVEADSVETREVSKSWLTGTRALLLALIAVGHIFPVFIPGFVDDTVTDIFYALHPSYSFYWGVIVFIGAIIKWGDKKFFSDETNLFLSRGVLKKLFLTLISFASAWYIYNRREIYKDPHTRDWSYINFNPVIQWVNDHVESEAVQNVVVKGINNIFIPVDRYWFNDFIMAPIFVIAVYFLAQILQLAVTAASYLTGRFQTTVRKISSNLIRLISIAGAYFLIVLTSVYIFIEELFQYGSPLYESPWLNWIGADRDRLDGGFFDWLDLSVYVLAAYVAARLVKFFFFSSKDTTPDNLEKQVGGGSRIDNHLEDNAHRSEARIVFNPATPEQLKSHLIDQSLNIYETVGASIRARINSDWKKIENELSGVSNRKELNALIDKVLMLPGQADKLTEGIDFKSDEKLEVARSKFATQLPAEKSPIPSFPPIAVVDHGLPAWAQAAPPSSGLNGKLWEIVTLLEGNDFVKRAVPLINDKNGYVLFNDVKLTASGQPKGVGVTRALLIGNVLVLLLQRGFKSQEQFLAELKQVQSMYPELKELVQHVVFSAPSLYLENENDMSLFGVHPSVFRLIDAISSNAAAIKDQIVMDVGSGTGILAAAMLEVGAKGAILFERDSRSNYLAQMQLEGMGYIQAHDLADLLKDHKDGKKRFYIQGGDLDPKKLEAIFKRAVPSVLAMNWGNLTVENMQDELAAPLTDEGVFRMIFQVIQNVQGKLPQSILNGGYGIRHVERVPKEVSDQSLFGGVAGFLTSRGYEVDPSAISNEDSIGETAIGGLIIAHRSEARVSVPKLTVYGQADVPVLLALSEQGAQFDDAEFSKQFDILLKKILDQHQSSSDTSQPLELVGILSILKTENDTVRVFDAAFLGIGIKDGYDPSKSEKINLPGHADLKAAINGERVSDKEYFPVKQIVKFRLERDGSKFTVTILPDFETSMLFSESEKRLMRSKFKLVLNLLNSSLENISKQFDLKISRTLKKSIYVYFPSNLFPNLDPSKTLAGQHFSLSEAIKIINAPPKNHLGRSEIRTVPGLDGLADGQYKELTESVLKKVLVGSDPTRFVLRNVVENKPEVVLLIRQPKLDEFEIMVNPAGDQFEKADIEIVRKPNGYHIDRFYPNDEFGTPRYWDNAGKAIGTTIMNWLSWEATQEGYLANKPGFSMSAISFRAGFMKLAMDYFAKDEVLTDAIEKHGFFSSKVYRDVSIAPPQGASADEGFYAVKLTRVSKASDEEAKHKDREKYEVESSNESKLLPGTILFVEKGGEVYGVDGNFIGTIDRIRWDSYLAGKPRFKKIPLGRSEMRVAAQFEIRDIDPQNPNLKGNFLVYELKDRQEPISVTDLWDGGTADTRRGLLNQIDAPSWLRESSSSLPARVNNGEIWHNLSLSEPDSGNYKLSRSGDLFVVNLEGFESRQVEELRGLLDRNLTEDELRLVKSVLGDNRQWKRKTDGFPPLIWSEPEIERIFSFAPESGQGAQLLAPELYQNKVVTTLAYGNLSFQIAESAKEVIALDTDPVTVAIQKLKARWRYHPKIKKWFESPLRTDATAQRGREIITELLELENDERHQSQYAISNLRFVVGNLTRKMTFSSDQVDLFVFPHIFAEENGFEDAGDFDSALSVLKPYLEQGARLMILPVLERDSYEKLRDDPRSRNSDLRQWLHKLKDQGYRVEIKPYHSDNVLGLTEKFALIEIDVRSEMRNKLEQLYAVQEQAGSVPELEELFKNKIGDLKNDLKKYGDWWVRLIAAHNIKAFRVLKMGDEAEATYGLLLGDDEGQVTLITLKGEKLEATDREKTKSRKAISLFSVDPIATDSSIRMLAHNLSWSDKHDDLSKIKLHNGKFSFDRPLYLKTISAIAFTVALAKGSWLVLQKLVESSLAYLTDRVIPPDFLVNKDSPNYDFLFVIAYFLLAPVLIFVGSRLDNPERAIFKFFGRLLIATPLLILLTAMVVLGMEGAALVAASITSAIALVASFVIHRVSTFLKTRGDSKRPEVRDSASREVSVKPPSNDRFTRSEVRLPSMGVVALDFSRSEIEADTWKLAMGLRDDGEGAREIKFESRQGKAGLSFLKNNKKMSAAEKVVAAVDFLAWGEAVAAQQGDAEKGRAVKDFVSNLYATITSAIFDAETPISSLDPKFRLFADAVPSSEIATLSEAASQTALDVVAESAQHHLQSIEKELDELSRRIFKGFSAVVWRQPNASSLDFLNVLLSIETGPNVFKREALSVYVRTAQGLANFALNVLMGTDSPQLGRVTPAGSPFPVSSRHGGSDGDFFMQWAERANLPVNDSMTLPTSPLLTAEIVFTTPEAANIAAQMDQLTRDIYRRLLRALRDYAFPRKQEPEAEPKNREWVEDILTFEGTHRFYTALKTLSAQRAKGELDEEKRSDRDTAIWLPSTERNGKLIQSLIGIANGQTELNRKFRGGKKFGRDWLEIKLTSPKKHSSDPKKVQSINLKYDGDIIRFLKKYFNDSKFQANAFKASARELDAIGQADEDAMQRIMASGQSDEEARIIILAKLSEHMDQLFSNEDRLTLLEVFERIQVGNQPFSEIPIQPVLDGIAEKLNQTANADSVIGNAKLYKILAGLTAFLVENTDFKKVDKIINEMKRIVGPSRHSDFEYLQDLERRLQVYWFVKAYEIGKTVDFDLLLSGGELADFMSFSNKSKIKRPEILVEIQFEGRSLKAKLLSAERTDPASLNPEVPQVRLALQLIGVLTGDSNKQFQAGLSVNELVSIRMMTPQGGGVAITEEDFKSRFELVKKELKQVLASIPLNDPNATEAQEIKDKLAELRTEWLLNPSSAEPQFRSKGIKALIKALEDFQKGLTASETESFQLSKSLLPDLYLLAYENLEILPAVGRSEMRRIVSSSDLYDAILIYAVRELETRKALDDDQLKIALDFMMQYLSDIFERYALNEFAKRNARVKDFTSIYDLFKKDGLTDISLIYSDFFKQQMNDTETRGMRHIFTVLNEIFLSDVFIALWADKQTGKLNWTDDERQRVRNINSVTFGAFDQKEFDLAFSKGGELDGYLLAGELSNDDLKSPEMILPESADEYDSVVTSKMPQSWNDLTINTINDFIEHLIELASHPENVIVNQKFFDSKRDFVFRFHFSEYGGKSFTIDTSRGYSKLFQYLMRDKGRLIDLKKVEVFAWPDSTVQHVWEQTTLEIEERLKFESPETDMIFMFEEGEMVSWNQLLSKASGRLAELFLNGASELSEKELTLKFIDEILSVYYENFSKEKSILAGFDKYKFIVDMEVYREEVNRSEIWEAIKAKGAMEAPGVVVFKALMARVIAMRQTKQADIKNQDSVNRKSASDSLTWEGEMDRLYQLLVNEWVDTVANEVEMFQVFMHEMISLYNDLDNQDSIKPKLKLILENLALEIYSKVVDELGYKLGADDWQGMVLDFQNKEKATWQSFSSEVAMKLDANWEKATVLELQANYLDAFAKAYSIKLHSGNLHALAFGKSDLNQAIVDLKGEWEKALRSEARGEPAEEETSIVRSEFRGVKEIAEKVVEVLKGSESVGRDELAREVATIRNFALFAFVLRRTVLEESYKDPNVLMMNSSDFEIVQAVLQERMKSPEMTDLLTGQDAVEIASALGEDILNVEGFVETWNEMREQLRAVYLEPEIYEMMRTIIKDLYGDDSGMRLLNFTEKMEINVPVMVEGMEGVAGGRAFVGRDGTTKDPRVSDTAQFFQMVSAVVKVRDNTSSEEAVAIINREMFMVGNQSFDVIGVDEKGNFFVQISQLQLFIKTMFEAQQAIASAA